MIILDVIIIILQLFNLYFTFKLYKILQSRDSFIDFVKDKFCQMSVDIGRIKNKLKEFEDGLSI